MLKKKTVLIAGVCCLAAVGVGVAALAASPDLYRRALRSYKLQPIAIRYFEWVSQGRIRNYFETHPVRKIQIGAGTSRMKGWLNTDIEPDLDTAYLDAMKPFPFPDSSVDYIFSEQMIEHIPLESGQAMLKECYRVLKPGGKIRTATPNLLWYVGLFQKPQSEETKRFIQEKMKLFGWKANVSPEVVVLNIQMRGWGHVFLYDPATLRDIHERAGFRNIREYKLTESDEPVFRGIDRRAVTEPQVAFVENIIMEAIK